MEGGGWYSLQAPFLFAYLTAPVHFRSALDSVGTGRSVREQGGEEDAQERDAQGRQGPEAG